MPRSLLTLRFINARLFLDPIRECYEAFVIYNFYMFLIAYLEVRSCRTFQKRMRFKRGCDCGCQRIRIYLESPIRSNQLDYFIAMHCIWVRSCCGCTAKSGPLPSEASTPVSQDEYGDAGAHLCTTASS